MKLLVTRRALNIRSRKVEAWEAATECGSYVARRTEDVGTPWLLYSKTQYLGETGSLKKAQRLMEAHASGKFPHCFPNPTTESETK
jgi:hypothetical protein